MFIAGFVTDWETNFASLSAAKGRYSLRRCEDLDVDEWQPKN
jgi:hypothetical protein